MLGSSHPEVFCKKVAFKNFENSQGNAYAGVFFLRKLQDACKFFRIFRSNFFAGHLQTAILQLYQWVFKKKVKNIFLCSTAKV